MLPTVGINKNRLKENGFVNAFVIDPYRTTQYQDAIYVLFKPTDFHKFRQFVDAEYDRTDDLVDDYDYEDNHVVLVYNLRPDLKPDFDRVRKGKYSETSQDFKKIFPEKVFLYDTGHTKAEVSVQKKIFIKSPDLRKFWEDRFGMTLPPDAEVWELFTESKETLKI